MQYFKNVDLTKLYPVSESAVRKWIEAAKGGKLDLQLFEHNGRSHIANTARNQRIIEELVERGKKYKNTRGHKVVTPKEGFYKLYSKKQVLDIIANLNIQHEIPRQYNYFDGGADHWDTYAQRLWREDDDNMLNTTIALLRSNFGNIISQLEGYDQVNVIDLGVGNCLPVKELLTYMLYDQAILGRYIGIDISSKMLGIAERNITAWFDNRVKFEGYTRDITSERFDDLLIEEDPGTTANLVLLLGGTLFNLRSPDDALRAIYNSMGKDDILITSTKLDSEETRRYFDFNVEPGVSKLSRNHRFILDLLNIDESLYEAEQGFDENKKMRYIRAKLKVDLTINFKFEGIERSVELHKGSAILLWRFWHHNTIDTVKQLDKNAFEIAGISVSKDRNFILTLSKIDSSPRSTV